MKEQQLSNTETNNTTDEQQPQPTANETPAAGQKSEIDLLNEKCAELEKQAVQYKDQLFRKAAEFENYKRRTESETMNFMKFAGENIITQLLPVLDDLTRSLSSGKEKYENDPLYKGIELINAKFSKILESQGLKKMETVGTPFNVDFHDALMQVPREDVPSHTIVEEVETGYLLFDKVIRHAKVIVSISAEEEAKN
ncbi:MAG: nucleotide exchange factor GrpE [Bacteroidota bacterium]